MTGMAVQLPRIRCSTSRICCSTSPDSVFTFRRIGRSRSSGLRRTPCAQYAGNALPPRIEPSSYWDQTFVKSKTNRSRGRCVLLADGCRRRCRRRRSPVSRIHPSDLQFGVAPPSRRPGRATPGRPRPLLERGGRLPPWARGTLDTSDLVQDALHYTLSHGSTGSSRSAPARCGPTSAGASRTGSATRCAGRAGFGHPRITIRSISSTVTVSAVRS